MIEIEIIRKHPVGNSLPAVMDEDGLTRTPGKSVGWRCITNYGVEYGNYWSEGSPTSPLPSERGVYIDALLTVRRLTGLSLRYEELSFVSEKPSPITVLRKYRNRIDWRYQFRRLSNVVYRLLARWKFTDNLQNKYYAWRS